VTEVPSILLIDDDEDDYILAGELLSEAFGGGFRLDWVSSWDSGLEAMGRGPHEVYLVGCRLGESDGLALIREAVAQGCTAPIILLTAQGSCEIDLEAMEAGAAGYLAKDEITASLLERAVRYAIERKSVEARLKHLTLGDSLTGLANRTLFHDRLDRTITLARREGRSFAVIMMDLNKFKEVNDTLGHEAGDRLLQEVAARLESVMRQSDTVARLGGDEFATILPTTGNIEGAVAVAKKIIHAVEQPVPLGDRDVDVGVSVGVAVCPEHGSDGATVLSHADAAMYEAKRSGSGYAVYGGRAEQGGVSSALLAGEIRQAIGLDEILIYHQPKLNTKTGRVIGVEALVRWLHPDYSHLGPQEFIRAAENTAVVKPLTLAVIRKALEQAFAFRQAGFELSLAVNVSARVLHDWELPGQVFEALEQWEMPADGLILQIGEAGLVRDAERARDVVARLTSLGVGISIDGFGAGQTSLRQLKTLPIKEIKIHDSFIRYLTTDAKDRAIVRSIVALCENLEITAVAEGVATQETWDLVTMLGCHVGQGSYVSNPLPPEEFANWMALWSPTFERMAGEQPLQWSAQ
jgi:diguanylate cyclase (GGDEF)-like protein